jgi:Ni/Co efflux regulator RcnB
MKRILFCSLAASAVFAIAASNAAAASAKHHRQGHYYGNAWRSAAHHRLDTQTGWSNSYSGYGGPQITERGGTNLNVHRWNAPALRDDFYNTIGRP